MAPDSALAQAVLTGITTGSIIALGAIGLSMVYSIGKVPNFAHGDLLTVGAYLALLVNAPTAVPGFRHLMVDGEMPMLVRAILFGLAAAGVIGGVFALGGKDALYGSWWPIDPPPLLALVSHGALAALVGGMVGLGAPSVVAAMVFAGAVMAGATPLLEKYVFAKFRSKGADLVMMLMASLALAFMIRFSVQTYFGGTSKSYSLDLTYEAFGVSVDVALIKFFDFYVAGSGVVLRAIDPPETTIATLTYSPVAVVAVLIGGLLAGYGAYRWRRGERAILGPYLLGSLVGVAVGVVLAAVLAGSGDVPADPVYATRLKLSPLRAFIIVLAVVMMGSLHTVLRATKLGKAMRATSDNRDLAMIRGINVHQVTMGVWIFAGIMAGVAGVTIGVLIGVLTVNTGFFFLIPMFAAVILGGLTIYGAILGSYLVGLTMEIGIYAIPGLSATYRAPLAFVVLFLVLLIKPEGITG